MKEQWSEEVLAALAVPAELETANRQVSALFERVFMLRRLAAFRQKEAKDGAPCSDIFVLWTALSGQADVLCSGDRDLVEPPASIFLASCGIEALTDAQSMRKLKG